MGELDEKGLEAAARAAIVQLGMDPDDSSGINGETRWKTELPTTATAVTAYLAAAGDGWRPIESAPKDGRSLMVWIADDQIAGPHVLAPISITAENAWWDDSTCDRIEPLGSVTHWRPLPAPPQQEPRP
jgi:hypothetical protein